MGLRGTHSDPSGVTRRPRGGGGGRRRPHSPCATAWDPSRRAPFRPRVPSDVLAPRRTRETPGDAASVGAGRPPGRRDRGSAEVSPKYRLERRRSLGSSPRIHRRFIADSSPAASVGALCYTAGRTGLAMMKGLAHEEHRSIHQSACKGFSEVRDRHYARGRSYGGGDRRDNPGPLGPAPCTLWHRCIHLRPNG
jgi:hypothetical protein